VLTLICQVLLGLYWSVRHAAIGRPPVNLVSIISFQVGITLPLSGRQEAWGGAAESWWRPVHSKGLFEVSPSHRQRPQASVAQATFMQLQPPLQ